MMLQKLAFGLILALSGPATAGVFGYDASLGSLPDAQGWTFIEDGAAVPVPTVSAGVLHQGLTDFSGYQYWSAHPGGMNFASAPVTLDARLRIGFSSFSSFPRGGYDIALVDDDGRIALLNISGGSVFLANDPVTSVSAIVGFDTTDAFHDYRLVIGPTGASLSIDGNLIVSHALGATGLGAPGVEFGDATILGSSQSQLQFLSVSPVNVAEPGAVGLFGMAFAGVAALGRRRNVKRV